MVSSHWALMPLSPLGPALFRLAHVAARKGDTVRATRLVRQAARLPFCRGRAVRRLAKYLTKDADPNGEAARDHAGIDALLEQTDESELPSLRETHQNIVAFSLIRRRQPVPEALRNALVARGDDDALILGELAADPDVDAHRLLIPLFERHGLPAPPLIRGGAGVDRIGFPDCPPPTATRSRWQ